MWEIMRMTVHKGFYFNDKCKYIQISEEMIEATMKYPKQCISERTRPIGLQISVPHDIEPSEHAQLICYTQLPFT